MARMAHMAHMALARAHGMQARTRLVSMVDVDLLVSDTLFQWMQTESK
jgi:hypothetical protein